MAGFDLDRLQGQEPEQCPRGERPIFTTFYISAGLSRLG